MICAMDSQGGLLALHASTGEKVWSLPPQESFTQKAIPLAITNGVLCAGQQHITAVKVATGKILRQQLIDKTDNAFYKLYAPLWSPEDHLLIFW